MVVFVFLNTLQYLLLKVVIHRCLMSTQMELKMVIKKPGTKINHSNAWVQLVKKCDKKSSIASNYWWWELDSWNAYLVSHANNSFKKRKFYSCYRNLILFSYQGFYKNLKTNNAMAINFDLQVPDPDYNLRVNIFDLLFNKDIIYCSLYLSAPNQVDIYRS